MRALLFVERCNDALNISYDKSFHKFPGEMELVLATLCGAVENLNKRPSRDIEKILEWLEDWDWVAEDGAGREWSFDWCVEILSMTRAEYDPGRLKEKVQAQSFSHDEVCKMKQQAMRGLASHRGVSAMA